MMVDLDSWPELIYRFVEHYRWEPQHLGPDTSAFYRKIRSQEVPLNLLLNLLLHVLPPGTVRAWLASPLPLSPSGPELIVRTPRDEVFAQPDIHLESATERVFIEVKVDARLGLEQVQKYALLHGKLREQDTHTSKLPCLLFVTRDSFQAHWTPRRHTPPDMAALAALLRTTPLSERVAVMRSIRRLEASYGLVVDSIRLGACTWHDLATALAGVTAGLPRQTRGFVAGFLQELARRRLCPESLAAQAVRKWEITP